MAVLRRIELRNSFKLRARLLSLVSVAPHLSKNGRREERERADKTVFERGENKSFFIYLFYYGRVRCIEVRKGKEKYFDI